MSSHDAPVIGSRGKVRWARRKTIPSISLKKNIDLFEIHNDQNCTRSNPTLFQPRLATEFGYEKNDWTDGWLIDLKAHGNANSFDDYRHISAARLKLV